jgi:hypothetical protein
MIEPYITERQCTTCKACKPITDFGRCSRFPDGYRRQCLVCSRASVRASHAKRKASNPKAGVSPTAWLLPYDDRPEEIKALDMALRCFRACEPAANLFWTIGSAA